MCDLPAALEMHVMTNTQTAGAAAIKCTVVTRCDSLADGARMELDANQNAILKLLGSRGKAQNLFSVEELAQFLEVSVRSIRRLHAAGAAPPRIRRSRRFMYPVEGVLGWMPEYLSSFQAGK